MRHLFLRSALLGCLIGIPLSACGSHQVDRTSWADDLAAVGVSNADLDQLEPLVREQCQKDGDALSFAVALAADAGDAEVDQMRVNWKNVCPSEVGRLDDALEEQAGLNSKTERVCRTPASQRDEEEQRWAEAMGCD